MAELGFIEEFTDGLKIYLRPVGLLPNAYLAGQPSFSLGKTGMAFSGCILHWRSRTRGSRSQYVTASDLQEKVLPVVPSSMRSLLEASIAGIVTSPTNISLGQAIDRTLNCSEPQVMGVLNVTPDSFSDGGNFFDSEKAIARGQEMAAAGASIIDVGGESTRPGAEPVWEGDEIDRIAPVIKALAAEGITVSVDTRRAAVMKAALEAGAQIINDVSALTFDNDSLDVVAQSDVPIILMHARGEPRTMQDDPSYDDVLLDVYDYLEGRIAACEQAGIDRSRLILDPGIGFGKRLVQDNGALINGLSLFHSLGCPILLGASRKRFIGAITGVEDAEKRVAGSLAAALEGVRQGVQIVRVHDVAETIEAVKMIQAFRGTAMIDAATQSS